MKENLNIVLFLTFKYCACLLSFTNIYFGREESRLESFVALLSSQGKC